MLMRTTIRPLTSPLQEMQLHQNKWPYFHVMAQCSGSRVTVDVAPVRIDLPEILKEKVPGFITEYIDR